MRPVLQTVVLAAAISLVAAPRPGAADESSPTLLSLRKVKNGVPRTGDVRRTGMNLFQFVRVDGRGRTVVAGAKFVVGGRGFADDVYLPRVARFLANGRLDRSFGARGVAVLPFTGRPAGLVLDSSDRIVLTGRFTSEDLGECVALRLGADGGLDEQFADAGLLRLPMTTTAGLREPSIDPADGSITALVTSEPSQIARFDADGEPDPAFGDHGLVALPIIASSFAIDASGRFAVSGSEPWPPEVLIDPTLYQQQTESRIEVRDATGALDPAFGVTGGLPGPRGGEIRDGSVLFDSAGRLIVLGHETGSQVTAIYRFLPDGTLDASFSEDGRADLLDGAPGDTVVTGTSYRVGRGATERLIAFGGFAYTREHASQPRLGTGWFFQAVDPSATGTVEYVEARGFPDGTTRLADLCVAPDGRSVIAVGSVMAGSPLLRPRVAPLIVRVDLTDPAPEPLPDVSVAWTGAPVVHVTVDMYTVTATIRVENAGPGVAANAAVQLYLSDDAVLDAGDFWLSGTWNTGTLRPGESWTASVETPANSMYIVPPLAGKRVLACVRARLEPDGPDNIAVSAPLE